MHFLFLSAQRTSATFAYLPYGMIPTPMMNDLSGMMIHFSPFRRFTF
jgi:hypothetical protein